MSKIASILFLIFSLIFGVAQPVIAQTSPEVTAGEPITGQFLEDIQVTNQTVEGKIIEVLEQEFERYDDSQEIAYQRLNIDITEGELQGQVIQLEHYKSVSKGQRLPQAGDLVLVNISTDSTGHQEFYIIDYVRTEALFSLFILFAIIVLLIGRAKGVTSLLGLASSFVIIFGFIIPLLQQGWNPILVALAGCALIIGITYYLAHGFNEKTHLAALGTVASLIATAILAHVFVNLARLSGFGAEETAFLQFMKSGRLPMQGLFMAGILIGAVGILDDITISQASIVSELKAANPKLKPAELFVRAMNVGRDHIASLVNTLILVYTASALPLLLLFGLDSSRSFMDVLNYEMIAEEIVRTLVGSIGLVLAVPITTFVAVYWKRTRK